ncbi:COP9 signalosome complex subunit 1 [Sodiomyces alkalinus F11]|uniref:COP9 signalosome complex subunit 1 n=1 Tax=Sodiomyces alkalinus (strain CBS 110278 / VKM F-3762 / F11) TaxID=1314773 RepID=A0A3N2Q801_SODAK|nr:COP9 signalosome complex subunit 1 [Sodiomyces alkalinus F11]ROT42765.1 COP9 signalosome complex subunit 1 [Sodiomyces alkalinus F11]
MAAVRPGLEAFFDQIRLRGGTVVEETPKFDLELYIQSYTGRTRFERLLTIGRCCIPLCLEALKAAVAEAKRGNDVGRYKEVYECIRIAAPSSPEGLFDQAWVDRVTRENRAQTHRLEVQLKGYKNNLVKESIRMGNEDLGRHFESIGELASASEAYSRMRPDVSTSKQIEDVGKHLIDVALQQRDWPMVLGSLAKITSIPSEDHKALQQYSKVVHGIAFMSLEQYRNAATAFLQINAGKHFKATADYSHIASPNDVAVYGGLLALATMDRQELQIHVLDNQNFRPILELESHIRKAISHFVNGRYSACLAILESYKPDYLLDIYLQEHLPRIYSTIRRKCIVEYCRPFSRITIGSLREAFCPAGEPIIPELVNMIRSGVLKARIDNIDEVLVAMNSNPRKAMQAMTLERTRLYEKEAMERIRRMSLVAANMEVKNAKKLTAAQRAGQEEVTDTWFDNSGDPMATVESQA